MTALEELQRIERLLSAEFATGKASHLDGLALALGIVRASIERVATA